MSNQTSPKVVAIVSYLTLIGWIIALILNNPKSNFASFHIRQALGLMLLSVVAGILEVIPFLGSMLQIVAGIAIFVLWIIALLSAIQEEKKPVPYVGEYFQDWFKGL